MAHQGGDEHGIPEGDFGANDANRGVVDFGYLGGNLRSDDNGGRRRPWAAGGRSGPPIDGVELTGVEGLLGLPTGVPHDVTATYRVGMHVRRVDITPRKLCGEPDRRISPIHHRYSRPNDDYQDDDQRHCDERTSP